MSEICNTDGDARNAGAPKDRPGPGAARIGVLLVNLGTPDAPTPAAVRRYLGEFLADRRVVDLPPLLWLPVLHGVILNTRPAKTARNYAKIWRQESNESPLRYYTRAQAEAVSRNCAANVTIDWAMRYGNPSIAERLTALKDAGCARILIIPLYPQYSGTTTASVADAVSAAMAAIRWRPATRFAPAFHDHPLYISALTAITRRHVAAMAHAPERVVISFHGVPQRYIDAGDPYLSHCRKTALLLREKMGWTEEFAPMAFQSKFGRDKWLEPSTEMTIKNLARGGVKNIAAVMPGFVSDCIETLEEIAIAARGTFIAAGGENLDAIPCLNDTPEMATLLDGMIRREASGWID